jgi:hypothetical protein
VKHGDPYQQGVEYDGDAVWHDQQRTSHPVELAQGCLRHLGLEAENSTTLFMKRFSVAGQLQSWWTAPRPECYASSPLKSDDFGKGIG